MGLIKLLKDPGQFQFYKGKGYQYGPREVPYGNDRPGGANNTASSSPSRGTGGFDSSERGAALHGES